MKGAAAHSSRRSCSKDVSGKNLSTSGPASEVRNDCRSVTAPAQPVDGVCSMEEAHREVAAKDVREKVFDIH